jgi:uncharacterized protein YsxB (DUF464 family)
MIKAEVSFVKNYCRVRVSGHSGYAEAGSDIVCASVSSMLILTLNTVTERFGCKADIKVDEDGATMDAKVFDYTPEAEGIIKQFAREVWELSQSYPENVTVNADFLKGEIHNA